MNMSAQTCVVLTAVFPLVLLAFMNERRALHIKVRKSGFFRHTADWAPLASVAGLALAVFGVQLGGLDDWWAFAAWAALVVSLVILFLLSLFHLVSAELDEDDEKSRNVA